MKHVPHTSNVEKYYHNADVLIHPSLEEGMSLSVMEAVLCNLPVICTEETGVEFATIIKSRSVDAIRMALESVKRNPVGMREKILPYTWRRYADGVMNIYNELYYDELNANTVPVVNYNNHSSNQRADLLRYGAKC